MADKVIVEAHEQGKDTVYISWFQVPSGKRRQHVGTDAYREWEKKLPRRFKYVVLHAANGSDLFWDSLGFSYRIDLGYAPDVSDPAYEASQLMVKGIHGAKTPKTQKVDPKDI